MVEFIHAADLHLDSAFAALPARQAAARRRECRETLLRLRDYVNREGIPLVLLAGDLLDSSAAFRETGEQLSAALIVAQQTADRIVAEAKSNAERIRLDADNQARKVIRQALDEKQTELDEIERLKVSRENFRTEYLALIQKFSDAASANFPLITSAPSGSEAVAAAPSAAATQLQAAVNPYGTQVQAAIDDLD